MGNFLDQSGLKTLLTQLKSKFAAASHSHTWASLTSKPTTLAAASITDGVTTNTAQTISGAKTFSAEATFNGGLATSTLTASGATTLNAAVTINATRIKTGAPYDAWTDGNGTKHSWYGLDFCGGEGVYHSVITDYFGITLKSYRIIKVEAGGFIVAADTTFTAPTYQVDGTAANDGKAAEWFDSALANGDASNSSYLSLTCLETRIIDLDRANHLATVRFTVQASSKAKAKINIRAGSNTDTYSCAGCITNASGIGSFIVTLPYDSSGNYVGGGKYYYMATAIS